MAPAALTKLVIEGSVGTTSRQQRVAIASHGGARVSQFCCSKNTTKYCLKASITRRNKVINGRELAAETSLQRDNHQSTHDMFQATVSVSGSHSRAIHAKLHLSPFGHIARNSRFNEVFAPCEMNMFRIDFLYSMARIGWRGEWGAT